MLTIHFGLLPSEVKTFKAHLARLTEFYERDHKMVAMTDGDSWEVWGEKRQSPREPIHFQIDTMTPGSDINFLAMNLETFFIRMEQSIAEGLRLCLTEKAVWSEEYLEYRW